MFIYTLCVISRFAGWLLIIRRKRLLKLFPVRNGWQRVEPSNQRLLPIRIYDNTLCSMSAISVRKTKVFLLHNSKITCSKWTKNPYS